MILIDFSSITIATVFAQGKNALNEDLLRHQILNSLRMYNLKYRDKYGKMVICCDGGSWRKDYYSQYGFALNTKSQYPGLFNSGPYFIVIINKLSDVLSGHQALLNTDYYKPWANHHYDAVVNRRQKMYEKYKDK